MEATAPSLAGDLTEPHISSNTADPTSSRRPASATSDDAAHLLARLQQDIDGLRVVKLARGNVVSESPAPSGSGSTVSGSWSSVDYGLAASVRNPHHAASPPAEPHTFQTIPVHELLEQDDRPTFVIDMASPPADATNARSVMYVNPALRACDHELCVMLSSAGGEQAAQDAQFAAFSAWFSRPPAHPVGTPLPSREYGGRRWSCSMLRNRYRIVYCTTPTAPTAAAITEPAPSPTAPIHPAIPEANALEPQSSSRCTTPSPGQPDPNAATAGEFNDDTDPVQTVAHDSVIIGPLEDAIMTDDLGRHHTDEFTNQVLQTPLVRPSFDWTRIALTPDIHEHIRFARSIDWGSTSLGPIETWPSDLRAMANLIMGSPHPAAMYWGVENVAIYNQAYIDLAGQKHPDLMGRRYQDGWVEIWEDIAPTMQSAWELGQSTMKNDHQLFINRHGFLEETFFSWSIVPLVGSDGQVVGVYNPAFENTRRKVNERRMFTLRELGEKTAMARDAKDFWKRVRDGLRFNDVDVPFALLYSVREDYDSDCSSMQSGSAAHPPRVQLEGAIGVRPDHHAFVQTLDLRSSQDGFAPYLRQAMATPSAPLVLSADTGTLPYDLLEGMDWRGFGDPPRTTVVLPVYPTTAKESVVGFIVMGTNPRRPYDDDYKLFIELLSRQLATSLASVVLFEEEIKRNQRAAKMAAMDREELRSELVLRTQEAVESEYKFTRMAAFAPVGMFIADSRGDITFANDMWWQISRHPRGEDTASAWMESVRCEDRPGVEAVWQKLLHEKVAITHEFRFKCSRQNGDHTIDTWVLLSAYPEKDEQDGNLKSIFGCFTDISSQKWAEAFQMQRREEAVELKRQQENFIDMTSHEMRNPLSAILQCADEIVNTVSEYRRPAVDAPPLRDVLDRCAEAANTINLCASHQHRIIDDILTLSKLDSQLLRVTPVAARPISIAQTVLKMFRAEAEAHGIELSFDVQAPYTAYGIDWVKLDSSRLQQVLINLMTNAVKFTQDRETRKICLALSASRDLSEVVDGEAHYFPSRREEGSKNEMLMDDKDWGPGEEMNLHFSVRDTGTGLHEDEKKLLFQRFSQASPRTHVKYGGSGLGLFISRMLTELQGGQIGVVSEKGVGSTFSFYIKCRRTDAPVVEELPGSSCGSINVSRNSSRSHTPSAAASVSPPLQPATGIAHQTSLHESPSGELRPPPPLPPRNQRQGHDVLIVEDNVVNQKVLQRQLRNCGNNTHVANHGGEALETLKRSCYWVGREADGFHLSVILMDLEMPVMDGMTCARRIRELQEEGTVVRHVPIIAVTAYARPERVASAKAAGIDDVISKPFRIPDLTAKIDELIAKYQAL